MLHHSHTTLVRRRSRTNFPPNPNSPRRTDGSRPKPTNRDSVPRNCRDCSRYIDCELRRTADRAVPCRSPRFSIRAGWFWAKMCHPLFRVDRRRLAYDRRLRHRRQLPHRSRHHPATAAAFPAPLCRKSDAAPPPRAAPAAPTAPVAGPATSRKLLTWPALGGCRRRASPLLRRPLPRPLTRRAGSGASPTLCRRSATTGRLSGCRFATCAGPSTRARSRT